MTEDADVVIIGSGISGAMCAWRLARRGLRVLVLEAGPRIDAGMAIAGFSSTPRLDLTAGYPNPSWAPRPDWSFGRDDTYIEQTGPHPCRVEYLRLVGGTTWFWTAGTDRLLPVDFRMRSMYGRGDDWPISYDDLDPYYLEAEREIGVAGLADEDGGSPRSNPLPMPPIPQSYADRIISEKLRPLGILVHQRSTARNSIPYDGRPRCDGFGTCTPICPTRAQYAAIVHVEKAEQFGARVFAECRVDRIEADSGGRITSVSYGRSDGSTGKATGRAFVLAANGVESPRLLLASASDAYPRGLANTSDQVGRNLMDHLGLAAHVDAADPLYSGRGPQSTSISFTFRDGPRRRDEAAFVLAPDARVGLFELTAELLSKELMPPDLDRQIRERAARRVSFIAEIEQLPDPANRVTIDDNNRDSAGQPRMRIHYSIGEYEHRGLARVSETFKRIAAALAATNLSVSDIFSAHHPMGTLRMGADPKSAVVDALGRSHDHANLFVAGSAQFPTASSTHPTLTIAALALRTADAVARQLA